jgi:uncharacterized protein YecE (DUF72 family)
VEVLVGDVVVGTCSWTDKTMVERWYPRGVSTAEARLRYYASRYDTVEVDSTFYGLPREDYARRWAERTPDGFTFHVKAYGLMTGHEVDERSLTPELREYDYDVTTRGRVRNPDERMVERAFEQFVDALTPLVAAGKMGGVLLQYPAYFTALDREHEHRNLTAIERAAAILSPLPVFVEFRHASWVSGSQLARTLRFLSERGLTYVAVDAPQIEGASVMPPITAATSPLGYVRFHGRNAATWKARTASAADRFDYLYSPDELAEWLEPVDQLASETERTWVMFNNCKYDYAPRNAREMAQILGDVVAAREGGTPTGDPVEYGSALTAAEEGASRSEARRSAGASHDAEPAGPLDGTLF